MKKLSENLFTPAFDGSRTGELRKEDIEKQDSTRWWRYIELENVNKYPKNELRSLDISYDIVRRLEKTMNIDTPEKIWIYFRNEVWQLMIEYVTPYGHGTYTISVHGDYNPWFQTFSELALNQKRSIKQRLDKKIFYVYVEKYNSMVEYILREEPEYEGKKGVLLK